MIAEAVAESFLQKYGYVPFQRFESNFLLIIRKLVFW